MFIFYIPWKHQKTYAFLIFSKGIEMEHSLKNGLAQKRLSSVEVPNEGS